MKSYILWQVVWKAELLNLNKESIAFSQLKPSERANVVATPKRFTPLFFVQRPAAGVST